MKKAYSFFAAAMIMACGLSTCVYAGEGKADPADKIRIVTTIFPEYDWVRIILGDDAENAELTMLLDNGVDLHSYQPTAQDMLKIASCDMFIYVGGESDGWVGDALKEATNEDMVVIDLLDTLGDLAKEEELVEGMEEDAHEEGHEEDHEEEHEHEHEYDEHVWLSLPNASLLVGEIAGKLAEIDEANADKYLANAEAYKEKLAALDEKYRAAVEKAEVKTILFGDRFPFRYLADDYGLEYYAAFAGCSAETEASFDTIIFLAGKTNELGLGSILTIEGTNHRIAETIRDNTKTKDQEILALDSMQSTTSKDVADGSSYLSIMEKNLGVLEKALQ